jgi:hypothetical protein
MRNRSTQFIKNASEVSMSRNPDFDTEKAYRYFAADCFNKAWELIEKADRTPEDDERMLRLAQASLWHWTERNDCDNTNLAIGTLVEDTESRKLLMADLNTI